MSRIKTKFLTDDAVTNAKLANMATQTIKGRTTGGTGDPEDLTATQATAILNSFVGDSGSGGTKGLVPAPAAGDATKVLTGNGTWSAAGSGTVTTVSVVSANGLAGSVATSTTTPAITLSTTITGVLSGNGTAISAASTTGSGSVVLATGPTLSAPNLGTPTTLVGTNITGTASGLTAGTVTTNANLTGDITSTGNATTYAGTVPINRGGTGQTTASTGFNALSPMTTIGDIIYGGTAGTGTRLAGDTSNTRKFLRTQSTAGVANAPAWDTIQAADVPTLNQNTTGTASNVTGTVAIANGGTGQVTKAPAFDALSPMTTGGDLIYGGASGTGTRLANGTAGDHLISSGGTAAPTWKAIGAVQSSNVTIATWPGGIGNGQFGDLTSVTLTAGTWHISAVLSYDATGAATAGEMFLGISSNSGTSSTGLITGNNLVTINPNTMVNGDGKHMSLPTFIVTPGSTTTYYLKIFATTTTNLRAAGRITAVRIA